MVLPAPFGPIRPVMLWLRHFKVDAIDGAQAAESPDELASRQHRRGGHLA